MTSSSAEVFASIVVVRGAARDSLHALFLILLYHKLFEILLMSTAASSGSNDFSPFVRIFIPSSSVLVFCGAAIHHDIDVLKERMVFAVIESFVCRSSCISFLGFWSCRTSTCFLVRVYVKDMSLDLCFRSAPVSRSILLVEWFLKIRRQDCNPYIRSRSGSDVS